ncbi:hypothetical protein D1BOALGB6SA_3830 [Olavius sp. associated proteobacterium Delta 1]|nr:hypothetical protein D1BOALGB6SA_3830 [Olavius sp. associated proteobacterium Delta 1]
MDLLLASAYLHDIARSDQDDSNGTDCRAEKGAQPAAPIVNKLPLTIDQKEYYLTDF